MHESFEVWSPHKKVLVELSARGSQETPRPPSPPTPGAGSWPRTDTPPLPLYNTRGIVLHGERSCAGLGGRPSSSKAVPSRAGASSSGRIARGLSGSTGGGDGDDASRTLAMFAVLEGRALPAGENSGLTREWA